MECEGVGVRNTKGTYLVCWLASFLIVGWASFAFVWVPERWRSRWFRTRGEKEGEVGRRRDSLLPVSWDWHGRILCRPQQRREFLLLPRWCLSGFLVGKSCGGRPCAWEGRWLVGSLQMLERGWCGVGKTSELDPGTWKASGRCWMPNATRTGFSSWLQKDGLMVGFRSRGPK